MSNPKNNRQAFDDAVIIIGTTFPDLVNKVPVIPPYPDDLTGTFELGDIASFGVMSEFGLGDIDDPEFGGTLGMTMDNVK